MDDCDEPSMPLEEQSVSEAGPWRDRRPDYELQFKTLINTTEESCPIEEEEAAFDHLEGVSAEPEHGQARPQLQPEFRIFPRRQHPK